MVKKPKTVEPEVDAAAADAAEDQPVPEVTVQTPATLGRIVHFYTTDASKANYGGAGGGPFAAVVTKVYEPATQEPEDGAPHPVQMVDLTVFPPHPTFAYSEHMVPGVENDPDVKRWWVWPTKVE